MTRRIPALLLIALVATMGLNSGWQWQTEPADRPPAPLDYTETELDGHVLLAEDPTGSGRVVEVLGDLDGAEHVAVVVPGSGKTRDNFRGSAADPGTVPLSNGRALYAEMSRRAPERDVAVVVWLGYLPPQGYGLEHAGIGQARQGAAELVRFAGEVLPGRAHVTLACHSYGTTVCGLATAQRGVADDVVALASPGMGVADAGAIRAQVWATRTPDDWIRWVPNVSIGPVGLGGDPMDPRFGATRFAPGGISGHTHYYRPGSAALAATAAIAAGDADSVDRAEAMRP